MARMSGEEGKKNGEADNVNGNYGMNVRKYGKDEKRNMIARN